MRKPGYQNIDEMKAAASALIDGEYSASMRLRAPIARPAKSRWLTVYYWGGDVYQYYTREGRKTTFHTREAAEAIIKNEWDYTE